jgi:hypothetical protein
LNTALDLVTSPVKQWMLSKKFQNKRASPVDYRQLPTMFADKIPPVVLPDGMMTGATQ